MCFRDLDLNKKRRMAEVETQGRPILLILSECSYVGCWFFFALDFSFLSLYYKGTLGIFDTNGSL